MRHFQRCSLDIRVCHSREIFFIPFKEKNCILEHPSAQERGERQKVLKNIAQGDLKILLTIF